jgi:sterol desaturase/sphingolipid hydroxylase (fatty acid hydroxylase superfamily)
MHHAFVKCNYSPYGSLWDRVFGTFKPFEVRSKDKALRVEAFNELGDDTLEKPLAGDERA